MLKKFFSGKSSEPASITAPKLLDQVSNAMRNGKLNPEDSAVTFFIQLHLDEKNPNQEETNFFSAIWSRNPGDHTPFAKFIKPDDLERLETELERWPKHRFASMLLGYISIGDNRSKLKPEPEGKAFDQLLQDIKSSIEACQSQGKNFRTNPALKSIITTVEGIQQSRLRPQLTAQLPQAESHDSSRGSFASSSAVSSPLSSRKSISRVDSLDSVDSGHPSKADSEPRAPSNPDTFTTPTATPAQIPLWLQAESDTIQADFKKDGTPKEQQNTLKDWDRTHHANRQSLTIIFPNEEQWQGLQPRSHAPGQNPITKDDLLAFHESCADNEGTKQQAQFLLNHGKIGQLQGMGLLGLKHFVQNTDGRFFVDDPSTESAITFQLLKDGNIAYTEQLTASVVDKQDVDAEQAPNYAITLRCKALISPSENTITWQEVESTGTDKLYAAVEPVRRSTQLQYLQEARAMLNQKFQTYRQQFGEIDTRGLVEISQYQAANQQIDEIVALLDERLEDDNGKISEHLINSRVTLEQAMKQLPQVTTVRKAVEQAIKDFSQQLQNQRESLLQQVGHHEQALKAITTQAGNTTATSEPSKQLEVIRSTSSIDLAAANLATEHQKLQQAQQQLGQLPSISQVAQDEFSRKQTALIADLKQWHTAIGQGLEKFKQVTYPNEQHNQHGQVINQLDHAKKQANSLIAQAKELRYSEISGGHFKSLECIQQQLYQLQSEPIHQTVTDLLNTNQAYTNQMEQLQTAHQEKKDALTGSADQVVRSLLNPQICLRSNNDTPSTLVTTPPGIVIDTALARNKFDLLKLTGDQLAQTAQTLIDKNENSKRRKVIDAVVANETSNFIPERSFKSQRFDFNTAFQQLRQVVDTKCREHRLYFLSKIDKEKLVMACMLTLLSKTLADSGVCELTDKSTYTQFSDNDMVNQGNFFKMIENGKTALDDLSQKLSNLKSSSWIKRLFARPSLFKQGAVNLLTFQRKQWQGTHESCQDFEQSTAIHIEQRNQYQKQYEDGKGKAKIDYQRAWQSVSDQSPTDHIPLVTPKNSLAFAKQTENRTTIPTEEITCAQ